MDSTAKPLSCKRLHASVVTVTFARPSRRNHARLDWIVLAGYFLVMVGIGWWSRRRVHNAADFFTAGGKMPWWLAGISHHMSGYSAAVFVGYAALAYTTGFAVYVWWALSITIACGVGAIPFAPRWPRLRQRLGIISPLEYLTTRYNLPAQQVLAWSGTLLKVFDVAAKWAASAILLADLSPESRCLSASCSSAE